MKIINAFTPAMLRLPATIRFREIPESEAREMARSGLESVVGHQGTADLFAARLEVPVPMNRASIQLQPGETVLLGQYVGPRLPEGKVLSAEELAAAGIRWIVVEVLRGG